MGKLKILILVKPFGKMYPKHRPKYDFLEAVAKYAQVKFWHEDGDIRNILKKIGFTPDFVYHYDMSYNYSLSPRITGLNLIDIPKGAYIYDAHWNVSQRMSYLNQNKIDLIFSATKYPFLKRFPKYKSKYRFLPFSVNPKVMKDWNMPKDRDFLLIGSSPIEWYPFRNEVYKKMKNVKGFVFLPHPGHKTGPKKDLVVNDRYAHELNRAKIFFTCGGIFHYPVLKFFEVPACKTLLLAEPNPDILDLGFKDGVHFVACNKSNFFEKAMFYLENEEKREELTQNGYDFIHAHHTHDVRAKQFINFIQEFLKTFSKRPARSPARRMQRRTNATHWTSSRSSSNASANSFQRFWIDRDKR
ncbi:glycosyltransferase [Ammoniphilus sp. YIM 78166]|uniref:glycosyltransferase family protein n=1 Tax=Ammoniphilus sp. YIM 78166 TaxID=1644106 RepID=UPI001F0F990E|nr:glycosyltransferase [Ammoniphilus sp. YIM 78166]